MKPNVLILFFDLPDLLLTVPARVGWIRLQIIDTAVGDGDSGRSGYAFA
jgi:hypothetical protein